MTALLDQMILPLETDVSIPAEAAPIGVQLWPTRGPEFAAAFTLAEVLVSRTAAGSRVTWVYENGNRRHFTLGELVFCRIAVGARA